MPAARGVPWMERSAKCASGAPRFVVDPPRPVDFALPSVKRAGAYRKGAWAMRESVVESEYASGGSILGRSHSPRPLARRGRHGYGIGRLPPPGSEASEPSGGPSRAAPAVSARLGEAGRSSPSERTWPLRHRAGGRSPRPDPPRPPEFRAGSMPRSPRFLCPQCRGRDTPGGVAQSASRRPAQDRPSPTISPGKSNGRWRRALCVMTIA